MNTFEYANHTLRADLAAYREALGTIVGVLPQANVLCDRIVKEVRLAQALLAFASLKEAAELSQILYHLTNLWPLREQPYARTLGFADEIAEACKLRDEALSGIKLLGRYSDGLAAELVHCLRRIADLLSETRCLLEQCDASIRPHAENMDITHKRLNLLIAAVDARVPEGAEQRAALKAYGEAAALLRDWENGVPLEERGVDLLARCIEVLGQADQLALFALQPAYS